MVFWGRLIFGVDLYSGKCSLYTYIYTYKRVVCVCLSVGLSVFFLSATRHLSTLRRRLRVLREQQEPSRAPGGPRARGQAHAQREHVRAHAVQLLNEKVAALMPFKNKTVRARACRRICNCGDFQKENQHATSQVQFTACLLLECLLSESY